MRLDATPYRAALAAGQRVWLVGDGLAVLEAKGDARLRID
jgi:hypothetical protein